MELRQLQYFVSVATEKQFIKAAAKLHVTQSALSQQIKKLEESLGVSLFDLQKRKVQRLVQLTSEGEMFFKDAKEILSLASKAKERLANLSHPKKILSLGYYRMLDHGKILDVLQILNQKHPNYEVVLQEFENHIAVQEAVKNNIIQYGISVNPLKHKQLQNSSLGHHDLKLLIHQKHPLHKTKKIELSQLIGENWIEIKAEMHPIYDMISQYCKKAGLDRKTENVQEVSSLPLLCHLVSKGQGIAFVPDFIDISAYQNTVMKDISGEKLSFEHCLLSLEKGIFQ